MAAVETRSRFNKSWVPGLFAYSREKFKRYPKTWQQFYSMKRSKRAYEESTYMSGYGYLVHKPEGTPHIGDARIQGPTKRWTAKTYSLMCRITEEAIEDDLYGAMKGPFKDLMVSAAATRHLLAMRPLLTGTATTYHTAGDGKAIFVSDHTRLDNATWSNVGSGADPNEDTLEDAVIAFEGIVDHRGKRYEQRARTIWSGPTWEFEIAKLLESTQVPGDNTNAVNTLRTRRGLKQIVDPEITDGRWGLLGEKDDEVGFIWFDRVLPRLSRHGDPDNGDAMFYVRERHSNEVNDPRQAYLVPEHT